MRIGLFLHHNTPVPFFRELVSVYSREIVGYCAPLPVTSMPKNIDFQPHPLELLVCSDVVMILSTHPMFDEIPRAALRRGVNLFFSDLTSYDLSYLVEIQQLAFEIGARVGFGYSGQQISGKDHLVDFSMGIYFLNITRKVSCELGFSAFKKSIIYDIATITRIKNFVVKKSRSIILPNNNCEYNLINASFEMANGSIVAYTADKLGGQNMVSYSAYGSTIDRLHEMSIDQHDNSDEIKLSMLEPVKFIESLIKGVEPDFTISMAIETIKNYNEISQKHIKFI